MPSQAELRSISDQTSILGKCPILFSFKNLNSKFWNNSRFLSNFLSYFCVPIFQMVSNFSSESKTISSRVLCYLSSTSASSNPVSFPDPSRTISGTFQNPSWILPGPSLTWPFQVSTLPKTFPHPSCTLHGPLQNPARILKNWTLPGTTLSRPFLDPSRTLPVPFPDPYRTLPGPFQNPSRELLGPSRTLPRPCWSSLRECWYSDGLSLAISHSR